MIRSARLLEFRRPVVIISSNAFNDSAINTVIVAPMTGNLSRAASPGNVLVPRTRSGLPKDSVVDISQLMTIDKQELESQVGRLPSRYVARLEDGLRLVLAL